MDRKTFDLLKNRVKELEKQINGGKGSGNFGHAGRPGERGGSASEGYGGGNLSKDSKISKSKKSVSKTEKIKKELDKSFKDWYSKDTPDDYQLDKIKDVTFREIAAGVSKGKDVYDIIGDVDSVIRERAFSKLSDITGLGYEDFYEAWMATAYPKNYKKSEAYKKFEKEYLQDN